MANPEIFVEHKPSPAKLDVIGVYDWAIWEKEESTFDWVYDRTEVCYILRGAFTLTPKGGEPIEFKRGDLITFPKGLECVWTITKAVEKHYNFNT